MHLRPSASHAPARFVLPALFPLLVLTGHTAGAAGAPTPDWEYATGGPVFSSPAHADGLICVGSDDGHVHAFDAHTGTLRWKHALAAPVRSQPLIEETSVIVVIGNDVVALARDDGAQLWRHSARDERGVAPVDRWDYHQSSAVRSGDLVYFGGANGVFHALDFATGAVRFTCTTEANSPIRTKPAVAGGLVYFGDWNGVVYAVDAATGELRWKHATCPGEKPYPQFGAVVSSMVAERGRLYFGLRNPEVRCLDAAGGALLWTFTAADGSWVPGTPVLADGVVFITGSDDHRVHALGADDGAKRWSCDVGANMFIAPLVVGDRVIASDGNSYAEDAGRGRLHVIARATGRLVRSVEAGGNLCASSPLLVDGRVIVASEDGRVRAFALATLLE